MASRSIARHITTLRNFYAHLIEKGVLDADPTAHLAAPRQWQSLPKYLNKKQIDDLMAILRQFQAAGPARSRHARISVCHRTPGLRVVRGSGVGPGNEHGRGAGGGQGQQAPDRSGGQVGALGGGAVPGQWPAAFAEGARQPIPVRYQSRRRDDAAGLLAVAGGATARRRGFSTI